MKLTFIGTSHGVPEHDRRCACQMLEINGKYYFIDMGTMAMEDLRRRGISFDDVKLIACTHRHGDHTDGVIGYVDLASWYFKTAPTTVLLPDQALIDAIRMWLDATDSNGGEFSDALDVRVYGDGVIYEDENVKITAYPTMHCENSHAFLVEAEGKKILFTGDYKGPDRDFPDMTGIPLDLIVSESAHFSQDKAVELFDTLDVKRVLINHVAPGNHETLARLVRQPHPYQYGVSFDGLEINL